MDSMKLTIYDGKHAACLLGIPGIRVAGNTHFIPYPNIKPLLRKLH